MSHITILNGWLIICTVLYEDCTIQEGYIADEYMKNIWKLLFFNGSLQKGKLVKSFVDKIIISAKDVVIRMIRYIIKSRLILQ